MPATFEESLVEMERSQRAAKIAMLWGYYRGSHARPLKPNPGAPDDNVIVNLARQVVDQGVAFLFPRPPRRTFPPDAPPEAARDLDAVWRSVGEAQFLADMALTGFVSGHVFIKLDPYSGGLPRPVILDPALVTAFWSEQDITRVTGYRIAWEGPGQIAHRQDISQEGGIWTLRDSVRDPNTGRWEVEGETIWPYPCAPIVDWKNLPNPHRRYGRSDLEHAALNDAVNFVASNINRILRYHAHPKTIGTGVSAGDIQETSVDSFWTVPNTEANIYNLEMESDLGSSLTYLDWLRDAFFAEARMVDVQARRAELANVTNFGLRMMFRDQLDKNTLKQQLYGAGLSAVNAGLLAILGHEPAAPALQWADPLPANDEAQVARLAREVDLGILSAESAAAQRGYEWEQERARIAESEGKSE